MLGGQQVLPERGKTAVASGAHLGELAFQVFAHGTDDFSFGHSGRRCSPGQTETRQAPSPTTIVLTQVLFMLESRTAILEPARAQTIPPSKHPMQPHVAVDAAWVPFA